MRRPRIPRVVPAALAAACVLGVPTPGVRAADGPTPAEWAQVQETLRTLLEEVSELRDERAMPATEADRAAVGAMGPAAARVYGADPGLSLGGYGEYYFAAPTGDDTAVRTADTYRFITYVGYKFDDRILMNTEIEFEHATTGSTPGAGAGSVSVEFAYLDFLLSPGANVRAGNLLMPAGFVNRMHEPPFYRGNFRPTVERTVLPSTWRELGAGLHGEPADGLAYEAYLVTGFDAAGYGPGGVRGGRQKGNRARWEDVAGILAVDWTPDERLRLGGSAFVGNAGQGRTFDGEEAGVLTTIAEGHIEVRRGGFRGRALVAASTIDDAGAVAAELGETVPKEQLGAYVEGSLDVAPWVAMPTGQALHVWSRWERLDLQREVPEGLTEDPARDGSSVAVGVEYLPHPQVVLKVDWTLEDDESGGDTDDPLRVGAGFVF